MLYMAPMRQVQLLLMQTQDGWETTNTPQEHVLITRYLSATNKTALCLLRCRTSGSGAELLLGDRAADSTTPSMLLLSGTTVIAVLLASSTSEICTICSAPGASTAARALAGRSNCTTCEAVRARTTSCAPERDRER
jgi:hypothetical protein